jgi:hypothetical protein
MCSSQSMVGGAAASTINLGLQVNVLQKQVSPDTEEVVIVYGGGVQRQLLAGPGRGGQQYHIVFIILMRV